MSAEALSLAFVEAHPEAAARVLEHLAPEAAAPLLAAGPVRLIAPLVRELAPFHAARCLEVMSADDAAGLLGALGPQSAAAVLRYLPATRRPPVLEALPMARAALLRTLIGYPEQTVGAWMDPDAPALRPDRTAEQALAQLRRVRDPDRGERVYVVDLAGRLTGTVSVGRLLRAHDAATLASLVQGPPALLSARAGLRSVSRLTAWDKAPALPVAEWGGRFAGALHRADLARGLARREAGAVPIAVGEALGALARTYGLALTALVEAGLGAAIEAGSHGHRGTRA